MLDRPRTRLLAWFVAYAAAALVAAVLPRTHGIVPWYPPMAVGVGILVAGGLRWWPLVAGLELVIAAAAGTQPTAVVVFTLPTLIEIPFAAWMLRRLHLRFLGGEDALVLALVAMAAATIGGGLSGLLEAGLRGVGVDPLGLVLRWWLCDVTTLVTVLPLALLVVQRDEGTLIVPEHRYARVEIAAIVIASVLTIVLTAIAFTVLPEPKGVFRALWVIPIIWMAVRYERVPAAIIAALMATVGFLVFLLPVVPASDLDLAGLQVSLVSTTVLGLMVSAALAGRREAIARLSVASSALAESERRYAELFAHSPAIQFLVHADTGAFLDANDAAVRFFGQPRALLLSRGVPDVFAGPPEQLADAFSRARVEPIVLRVPITIGPGDVRTMEIQTGPVEIGGRVVLHSILQDVSDQVAARLEVARLAAAIESSAESVITTDLDGAITGWNAAAELLYGYSRGEALGRTVGDLLGELEISIEELASLAREWRSVRFGYVVRRAAGGETVPVDLTISPIIADGAVIGMSRISHDLRHILREEERLRRSEALLADAAAIGRMGSWEVDTRSGSAVWSDELYRITGVPAGSPVRADSLPELAHPDDAVRVAAAFRGPVQGAPLAFRLRTRDGLERSVVASWRQVGGEGGSGRTVGILRDETEERRKEEQLRQAQRLESIGMLAGGVAHDFNNLLTAISGFTDLARSAAELGSDPGDDLAQVEAAVERGRALTSQLLAFGRRRVARPRPVDVGRTVTALVPMLRRLLGEDVSIITELDDDVVAVIDPGQLDQVLVNLSVNARDAMPDGGQLRIATGRVGADDDAADADGRIWLEVEDGGHGIAPDLLERIFEPFFTTKERGRGTGLGLATVQGIVDAAGGSIEVRSALGRGSVFRVELPGIVAGRATHEDRIRRVAATGREQVLVVEDEELVRRVAVRVLERAGFRVVSAANVPDALEIAGRGRPDILVTDIVLPGIGDGVQLAEELHARWPELPILLVTGYTERVPPSWATLLPKPYETGELVAEVRRLLDEAAAAAADTADPADPADPGDTLPVDEAAAREAPSPA